MPLDPTEFAAAMATYLAANDHTIAHRRGLKSALPSGLLQGELYYSTDDKTLHVGHGDATAKNAGLMAYPIGAIYESVVSTSPATLFGGTWVAFGTGRVTVAIDAGQTEFDTVEETGGAKTHTLTIPELPSHNHGFPDQRYFYYDVAGTDGITGSESVPANLMASASAAQGSGTAHNNLQPYITVYRWKRTA